MNKEMNKTKSKTGRYLIIAAVVLVALVLLVIQSCTIRTPEIHGVVLDAETKKPVAEAWIREVIGIDTLTVSGDIGRVVALAPPHLRSDNDGTFVLPARKIRKTPFPLAFGTNVDDLVVTAWTLDEIGVHRTDSIGFWNRKMEVTIYLEDREAFKRKKYTTDMTEEEWKKEFEISEFSGLQSLYDYCRSGRLGIEVAIEKSEGCDDWELDFAIKKHERFLKKLKEPIGDEQLSHYGIALKQLAYLYKMKRNYQKSLELFKSIKEFDEKLNIRMWIKEYETQIRELEQLLE